MLWGYLNCCVLLVLVVMGCCGEYVRNMSGWENNKTPLEPSFCIINVDGVPTTVYNRKEEMDGTASSSVKFVGKVVPETDVLSLSLPTQQLLSAADLSRLISTPQEATWTISDADYRKTARTKQSRSPSPMPRSHLNVSASKQRRLLSPNMAQSQELRSRYAQLKLMQMLKYVKLHMDVNSLEDPITRGEAGAVVNLQQQGEHSGAQYGRNSPE